MASVAGDFPSAAANGAILPRALLTPNLNKATMTRPVKVWWYVTDPAPRNPRPSAPTPEPPLVLDALKIFQGRREVLIELAGVRYQLRITRRNKLVLRK